MKTRDLYIIIIALSLIAVLLTLYSRDKSAQVNQPQKQMAREEAMQPQAEDTAGRVVFSGNAITVLKPAQKRETALAQADKAGKDVQSVSKGRSAGEAGLSAGNGKEEKEEPLSAGVTLPGKYLTPEDEKEMNSKGIVIY